MPLLLEKQSSQQIAKRLKHPLSIVQRRIRVIYEQGFIANEPVLNYLRFGISKGLLHIYLQDGNPRASAEKLLELPGVISAAAHIGNSDILLEFVFKGPDQILKLISSVKHMDSVEKVVWSQEVFKISKARQFPLGDNNEAGSAAIDVI